ncbi:unnamed protein product, partial [Owenia fusiformis]
KLETVPNKEDDAIKPHNNIKQIEDARKSKIEILEEATQQIIDETISIDDAWDVFQHLEKEYEDSSQDKCMSGVRQAGRVLAYVLLFCLVLASGLASKLSLLLVTNAVKHEGEVKDFPRRDDWLFVLCGCIALPYAGTFLSCLFGSMAENIGWPGWKCLLGVMVIETVHVAGLLLFTVRVLPHLDVIRAILLMSAVLLIPALMKLLFADKPKKTTWKVASYTLGVVLLLMQLSVFGIFVTFGKNMLLSHNAPITAFPGGNVFWEIPVSLFLLSFGWWENYADIDVLIGPIEIPLQYY